MGAKDPTGKVPGPRGTCPLGGAWEMAECPGPGRGGRCVWTVGLRGFSLQHRGRQLWLRTLPTRVRFRS